MIKDPLIEVQQKLVALEFLSYVGEDWGQLDYYKDRPPVTFPCALIDTGGAKYSNRSRGSQDGEGVLLIRYADFQATRVSATAPDNTRGFEIIDNLSEIHKAVQGLTGELFSGLTRVRVSKVRRDDGIREFEIEYRFGFVDNTAVKVNRQVKAGIKVN